MGTAPNARRRHRTVFCHHRLVQTVLLVTMQHIHLGSWHPLRKILDAPLLLSVFHTESHLLHLCRYQYGSGMVNSNMVNSKFYFIRSYCEIFFYHFPNISCLKCTVNSNFHLIRSKIFPTNDFKLTVPNL